jgi:hypothetical protein
MLTFLVGLFSRAVRLRYFRRTGRWWWGVGRLFDDVFHESRS